MRFNNMDLLRRKTSKCFPTYLRSRLSHILTSHIRTYDYIMVTADEVYKTCDEKDFLYYLDDVKKFVLVLTPNRISGMINVTIWSPKAYKEALTEKYKEEA